MNMDKQPGMMGQKKGNKDGENTKKGNLFLLPAVVLAAVLLLYFFPENREKTLKASYNFFIEIVLILPGVLVLTGLFSAWVKNETVVKYLGHASGFGGVALSFFLGMIPTGPLYVAFPIAGSLLKKGARTSNIIIFLSSWACIKLPQELVEMRFMGIKFMVLRLIFTILLVYLMGLFIEKAAGLNRAKRNDES